MDDVDLPITFDKFASGQPDGTMDQPYLQMSSTHNGEWEDTASGTQNVICVRLNNHVTIPIDGVVPPSTASWQWYDTSFGTVMMKKVIQYWQHLVEERCIGYGGPLYRPFLPTSTIENEWFHAYYKKVQFSNIFFLRL